MGKERSVARAPQGARDGLRAWALLKGLPPNYQEPLGMRWENNRLVPDVNYDVACGIWRMALEGTTQWGIAKSLTARGISTPKGRMVWSGTTVGSILTNLVYAGVVEALKTEAVAPRARRKATYGNSSSRRRPQEERVRLEGLVAAPIVTEEEFQWALERRRHNQRYAAKNTKMREYLLKGRIRCARCARVYTGVTRGDHAYYYCRGRAKVDWGAQKCSAEKLKAQEVEQAVYETVVHVLESPEVYLGEVERRWESREQTINSLRRAVADLDRQAREEREAEAQAIRLASRFEVSDDAFQQEVGLIRTRRRWIGEERGRVQAQLDDLGDGPPDPAAMAKLGDALSERLAGATPEDRRSVLDAVGATIIAQGDGTWELELEIPQEPPPSEPEMQIVNS
ncbi:MAG: recombinase family protein, partial [Dehalococcoidia bacterium]